MLQRLYDRTLALAAHPRALPILCVVAAAESSVFPIPVEAMMLPMMFARPKSSFKIAFWAVLASVLGGVIGYAIGYGAFESVGRPIFETYGYTQTYHEFQSVFAEWGWWIVVAGGFTPLPYKVVTIAAGVAQLDLLIFILASLVSRGARFFLEAALIYWFGEPVRAFIEKRLALTTTVAFALLIGGFLALRLLA